VPAERRVYLHIGAPKTGTTYLQAVCARNRDVLRANGLSYPDAFGDAHHKAVWDLRDTPDQREASKGVEGSWDRLVEVVAGAEDDVLLSSEHFVFATPRHVDRAMSTLRGELHLIYTARDLGRQVPAVWQERIKNQKTVGYHEFVSAVIGGTGPGSRSFWTAQHAAQALDKWSSGAVSVAADRVHVVTAPPPGGAPTLLWERFARVVGLETADVDTSVAGSANESLSMMQTELLRRYNVRHAVGVPWPQYRRIMRRQLDVLTAVDDGRKVALTPDEPAFFSARAEEICAALTRAGYDVAGDLADLVPNPRPPGSTAEDPSELTDAELLDAALDVVHQLLTTQAADRASRRASRRPNR
jgi:hypothetical protein